MFFIEKCAYGSTDHRADSSTYTDVSRIIHPRNVPSGAPSAMPVSMFLSLDCFLVFDMY